MALPENRFCADCGCIGPKWASCNLGVFICLNCSGIHRSLGTHISFVKSCTLDHWTQKQLDTMKCIGNKNANEYWEYRLPRDFVRPNSSNRSAMESFIIEKYVHKKWINPIGNPRGKLQRKKVSKHTDPIFTEEEVDMEAILNQIPDMTKPKPRTLESIVLPMEKTEIDPEFAFLYAGDQDEEHK